MGKKAKLGCGRFRGNWDRETEDYFGANSGKPVYERKFENDETVLGSEREITEESCPVITSASILIDLPIYNKIRILAKSEDEEWLGILRGERKENGEVLITGLEIPKQTRGMATCQAKDKVEYPDLVGWIHSHNDMDTFFSSVDDETNNTTNVSIVVNKEMHMKGIVVIKAPCEHYFKVPADITIMTPNTNEKELENWYKGVKKNLEEEEDYSRKHIPVYDKDAYIKIGGRGNRRKIRIRGETLLEKAERYKEELLGG